MKNRILNITKSCFIAILIVLSGCDQNEFLTKVNPNSISQDIFWKTESDAMGGLTTVYAALQFQGVGGGEAVTEMVKTDLGGTNSFVGKTNYITEFNINDNSPMVTQIWSELYIGIFRANQVIEQVALMTDVLEQELIDEIVAEAKFLRAFFYFQIAHTYGQGVITTSAEGTPETIYIGLSTKEEITEQIIKPDLMAAIDVLPQERDDVDKHRVTWGAAKSLLGKVYLYEEEWELAAIEFEEVIGTGLYSLVPDREANFRDDDPFNSESIFEVAFNGTINPGATNASIVDDTEFNSGSESSTLARWFAPYFYQAWQVVIPTYSFHELMAADSISGSSDHSSRYRLTLAAPDSPDQYYQRDADEHPDRIWGNVESSYVRKYTNAYHQEDEGDQWRTSINFKFIRYADVLLMCAEAVLEGRGDIDAAIGYIDQVRTQAGVVTLDSYRASSSDQIPELHKSAELYGPRPYVNVTVESIRTHLRRVERPTELAYENHRWKDLVRWGIVKEVFDEQRQVEIDRLALPRDANRPPLFIKGDNALREDFAPKAANYNSEAHDYLPVPNGEVENNTEVN
ncbi:RagB/SusD family nutrient uptake outer membrane protein [Reichenbachiella versicolor]|uniref:RagB/SusD family nutrient uptake outer membrane protein n=1 Tax=Reichenbachiella versicolor TaxID=1821036 RepID=UPI000D6E0610|nr:RagB/SusD family nutrient uptake outer membrane protein [Reichenbachiella versicolor]